MGEPAAMDGMAELIGRVFADRYRIDALLGRGGMGAVYRAHHLSMNKPIALKVLARHLSEDPQQVARFNHEALASSRLKHPNTIRVFDYGQSHGYLFLAMELLEGQELSRIIRREGPLDPARVVRIARQVVKSVGEAHEQGLVHRDLKPDNIFLCDFYGEKDFVKVLDFGIAKSMDEAPDSVSLTQNGFISGTPLYIAPEQALGHAVTPRTDLYSLGVILYQMLVGVPPFRGETPIAIVVKHIHEAPPPLRQFKPDLQLPPELEGLVLRLLAKDARRRPASAEEVALALQAIPADEPPTRLRFKSFTDATQDEDTLVSGTVSGERQEPGSDTEPDLPVPAIAEGATLPAPPPLPAVARASAASPAPPHPVPGSLETPSPSAEGGVGAWPLAGPGATAAPPPTAIRGARRGGGWAPMAAAAAAVVLVGGGVAWWLLRDAPEAARPAAAARASGPPAALEAAPGALEVAARAQVGAAPAAAEAAPAAPAAEVPAAAEAAVEPPEAAAPRTVTVRSEPPGASVYEGESLVGVTPLDLLIASGAARDLVLRLDGHAEQAITVSHEVAPEEDLQVRLEPVAADVELEPEEEPARAPRRAGASRPGAERRAPAAPREPEAAPAKPAREAAKPAPEPAPPAREAAKEPPPAEPAPKPVKHAWEDF